ncbi:MAG: flagellar hook protein FlgE [Polyangiaceae bacterium]
MSILHAMYSGVSGIKAEGEALGVVGDNISNTNTVGFKAQRAVFQDVLGHSISAGTTSALPGSGVRMADVQQLFTQGSLSNTGVATDLALSGDGFFVMQGNLAGVQGNFYTRNGQWTIDKEGFITNLDGLKAQGYAALQAGGFAASVSSIQVPTAAISPNATTTMTVTANLDSNAAVPTAAWNAQNPAATSNFSTSISVFDSLGNAHTVDVYFRKTGAGAWEYHALGKASEVTAPAPGAPTDVYTQLGTGTMTFTTSGALQSLNPNPPTMGVTFTGAAAQTITADFGNAITPPVGGVAGTGLDGITQFSGASNVSSQQQNGYASGSLSGIGVDGTGVVRGMYTNGQQLAIGQLAIAKFQANESLGRAGNNMWIETRESGNAALGTAGSGGRGAVSSGALEGSNVDLAQQFVDLIAHQRAFEANSKTITTADEMLQTLQNIKR